MTDADDLVSFMDSGVLRMPYAMAMSDELSRRQFYGRVQSLLDRIESRAAIATQAAQPVIHAPSDKAVWMIIDAAMKAEGLQETGQLNAAMKRAVDAAIAQAMAQPVQAQGVPEGWSLVEKSGHVLMAWPMTQAQLLAIGIAAAPQAAPQQAEPLYTLDQIALACAEAGVSESKFESISIELDCIGTKGAK
ncbi:hypothetical protein [Roseateles sp. PN1]|uniref:hypothetical protein n=1 Tax=Roseateles sp. PN1 TaxID=3137372 RepID=UPI00313A4BA9